MNVRGIKSGLVGHDAAVTLLLAAILTITAAAQSSSNPAAYQSGGGAGQDCTRDSSVCSRGLLCLPISSGQSVVDSRRVCRQPRENEVCDSAAPCEGSSPNGPLACLPVSNLLHNIGEAINFPGRSCVRAFARGRSCGFLTDCLPGLLCGSSGLLTPICIFSTPRATLGQDCTTSDCEENLLCKKNSNGSRRCVGLIPEGQPCNPNDYELSGNPCAQPESQNSLNACVKGRCVRGIPLGASCPTAEDPTSWSVGQCNVRPLPIGLDRPKCIKAETGALKCLLATYEVGPCGDSINTGCANPDMQCIKGYCGVPNGGQGDLCGPGVACKPGLRCIKSPLKAGGSRCSLEQDAGYSCDPKRIYAICKDGLKCSSKDNFGLVCIRGSVPIGGKCVDGEAECAPGLTCIPNGYPDTSLGGKCMLVSNLGGVCNPGKFQICNRLNFLSLNPGSLRGAVLPLECVNGKCVNSTVGLWGDACGAGEGVNCARQDEISKLQLKCEQNVCASVNGSVGQPCEFNDDWFGSRNGGCASDLYCSAVNHPPVKSNVFGSESDYVVFKCVRYVSDGERCDYSRYIGCRNRNSSCVHGVCSSS